MTQPVLLIGGMDSSGGAGLARDLLAVQASGQTACLAVTAVTAQTDRRVLAVEPVAPSLLAAQIEAALEAGIGAVKIGALFNAPLIRVVAALLPDVPVVLDPVLCSSSGHALLDPEGMQALIALLLPRTTILTPNLPELAALAAALGIAPTVEREEIVNALLSRGCRSVLLKGGHDLPSSVSEDVLYETGSPPVAFRSPRFAFELRGTGCQLASALAAGLVMGQDLPEAIRAARCGVEERFRNA
ncbi:hydroxymethylpyrimidine/phosphomethylpyrimidine kinase family protein [Gluconobacter kondonii]|uniref:hydroxymethylpyrimidine/phosphomethylpyrimidine kinase family protein n=1 Tax=Gluconobacter kondonii TaxID=941463 RepID=UPI001B8BB896|nr:bifunctional hydroxymethylpyrimidine kinase/phosphomethylpyrimidine kinase [Gluconobacter kondonii]MBS1054650.1 hydroxymethylpyrimidine/phosphomethylpyrimidine kinase [Gluconobacter kondonii]MBS1055847.1 hydroxymethylpyrimidine/phosphomethylpyrimidine kinase [Gluconobacter kondonii]